MIPHLVLAKEVREIRRALVNTTILSIINFAILIVLGSVQIHSCAGEHPKQVQGEAR